MNSSESDPSLSAADQQFSLIMDEIVDTIRNGQSLSVEDWVKRYPQHEKQLRDFLPVLAFAEDINEEPTDDKYSKSSSQHSFASSSLAVDTCPERLGDFEIKCELGRGGMGVVYSAWQHSLRRPVALKILAQHLTRDARFVARFQREAQSAARLNHPNLVQVYGIGQDQGVWYYAMQLIDGSTISDVLQHLSKIQKGSHTTVELHQSSPDSRKFAESLLFSDLTQTSQPTNLDWSINSNENFDEGNGKLSPPPKLPQPLMDLSWEGISAVSARYRRQYFSNVAALVRDVALAINYAHTQGTIHRDIKPSNLLLDRSGRIWITDFGLAKIEEEAGLTMSGDLIGTLRYTAPEQLNGVSAPSCDIFSLGLTLYELLTLQPAIAATDKLHIIYQVREQEPTPPRAIDPRIPVDLETITLKAICKDTRSRYASAKDFADDLIRFLEGRPILARPVNSFDKLVSWSKRNRLVASLVLLILIGLITVSIGSTIAAIRFRDLAQLEADSRFQADAASKHASAAEAEMRRRLYISEMNLGLQSAKLPGSLPKLRRIVQRWQEDTEADDFRGWEWDLLHSLTEQESVKIPIEDNVLSQLSMSADRTTVAWIENGDAVVYSLGIQQVIQRCHDERRRIESVCLSSDGSRLLVGFDNADLAVLLVQTGKTEFSQALPNCVTAVAWHPGGREIVLVVPNYQTGRADLYQWELTTNTTRLVIPQGISMTVVHISFSADGSKFAASHCTDPQRTYVLSTCIWNSSSWNIETQKSIAGLQPSSYAWSPDGRKVAIGTFEGDVWIWNLQDNLFEASLKLLRSVRDLDWHPSGKFLCVACEDATALQWIPEKQTTMGVVLPHDDAVVFARYGANGDQLVSLDGANIVRVWDIETGLVEQQHQLVDQFDAQQVDVLVEFSPQDDRISAGAAAPSSIWQTGDGSLVDTVHGSYLNWSFDGAYLASKYNETVTVWDSHSLKVHATNELLGFGILRVWSPKDYRLTGNDSQGLWIWDIKTNHVQRSPLALTEGGPDAFRAIAWSPDGKRIAVAADSNWLYLVNSETLECEHRFQATTTKIHALAWSPDGAYLAVAAAQPHAIIVSADTGETVKQLDAHSYEVRSIAWSPNGKRIATGGADRQLLVWNPDWALPVISMEFDSEVRSVAWSHDNQTLAGLGQNGRLKLWRARKMGGARERLSGPNTSQ